MAAAVTAPDRWHQLVGAVTGPCRLPPSDRQVFRYLLDKADYRTADLPARWTPTEKEIVGATGLSLRQVKYSIRHLERHGWLTAKGATGPGRTLEYRLDTGEPCTCTGRRHVPQRAQPQRPTGATTAPERVQPTGATSQVRRRNPLRGTERKEEREGVFDDPWASWPENSVGG